MVAFHFSEPNCSINAEHRLRHNLLKCANGNVTKTTMLEKRRRLKPSHFTTFPLKLDPLSHSSLSLRRFHAKDLCMEHGAWSMVHNKLIIMNNKLIN